MTPRPDAADPERISIITTQTGVLSAVCALIRSDNQNRTRSSFHNLLGGAPEQRILEKLHTFGADDNEVARRVPGPIQQFGKRKADGDRGRARDSSE